MSAADPLPPRAWAQIIDAATEYRRAGGDLNTVHPAAKDARGRPLGAWLVRVRRARNTGALPTQVATTMTMLGFGWVDRSAQAARSAHAAAVSRVAAYAAGAAVASIPAGARTTDGYPVGTAWETLRVLARRGDLSAADWDTLTGAGLRLPGQHPSAPPRRRGRPPKVAPPPPPTAIPAKYAPLHALLRSAASKAAVVLPLDEVAALVGGLPGDAYRYERWWTAPSKRTGTTWTALGYQAQPNLTARTVRFARPRSKAV